MNQVVIQDYQHFFCAAAWNVTPYQKFLEISGKSFELLLAQLVSTIVRRPNRRKAIVLSLSLMCFK